jgi:sec-independent protein translocase protein TatB
VFENLNGWELVALVLLGLFIFGPERLPTVIGDGVRLLRKARGLVNRATTDLSEQLGTDVRDLHPQRFVRQHLLTEDEEAALLRPIETIGRDMRELTANLNDPPPVGPQHVGPQHVGPQPVGPPHVGRHRRPDESD